MYCTLLNCTLLYGTVLFSAEWYYGERHGVMGLIPANFIKILAYGDDGEEKVNHSLHKNFKVKIFFINFFIIKFLSQLCNSFFFLQNLIDLMIYFLNYIFYNL